MEMESESSFTTHAMVVEAARTVTGSWPTGISAISSGAGTACVPGKKTESLPSRLLTARMRAPSGVISSGWV